MIIKKIIVKDLLKNDGSKKVWNLKNKITYFYGPNGIGKTTLLDSIYFALQNDKKIFGDRKIPYSSLEIKLSDGNSIEIFGNNIKIDFKKIFDEFLKYKNQWNDQITKKILYTYDAIDKLIDNISPNLPLSCKFLNLKKELKNTNKNEYHIKFKKLNNLFEKDNCLECKMINNILNNNLYKRKNSCISIYENLMNNKNSFHREKLSAQYNILYLTIERIAPKISKEYKDYNEIFVNHFKYLLVQPIDKILSNLKEEMDIYTNQMLKWNQKILGEIILDEIEQKSKKIKLPSMVELCQKNLKILNIIIDLIIEKTEKEKEKIIESIKNKKHSKKSVIGQFINALNSKGEDLKKIFNSMEKFIVDVNDFFASNNKKIIWNRNAQFPKIKDDNSDETTLINEYNFSSGERQIITILYNIHFIKEKKLLILADEIEVSLSIDWQEMLYEKIEKIDNVQLIGVTHSPFIVTLNKFENSIKEFNKSD